MRGKRYAYFCGVMYLLTGIPLVGIVSVFVWAHYSGQRNG